MKLSSLYSTLKFAFSWPLAFVSLIFLIFTISKQQISYVGMIQKVNPVFILLSLVCFIAYFLVRTIQWDLILKAKNHSLSSEKATYIWTISELKRFIPGNFWAFLGRGLLLSSEGIKKKEILHLLVVEVEFFVTGCIFISLFALPFLGKYVFYDNIFFQALNVLFQIIAVLSTAFFVFHKNLFPYFPKNISKKIEPVFPGFTYGMMFEMFFLTILYLVFFGLGSYFAVLSLAYITPILFIGFVSFFIFSLFFGYVTLLTPMGLGVREGIISLGLAPFIGLATGVIAAFLARILQIIAEMIFLLFVIVWHRNKKIQRLLNAAKKKRVEVLLGICTGVYIIYFTVTGFLRYDNFFTGRFDLGNMDQTVWNTLQGNLFQFTDPNGVDVVSRLAFHADVILVLLAPLYMFWSDPRALIMAQAIVVGAGGIFVFLISKHILKKSSISLAVSIAYFLNPSLSYSLLYDFHPVVLATGFFLAAYYYFLKKKYVLFFVLIILSALTKEEVWIITAFLGLRLALSGVEQKGKKITISRKKLFAAGLATFILSLGIFYFLVSRIIPSIRGDVHFALSYYSHLGSTPRDIFLSLFLSPQKWVLLLFAPERISYLLSLFLPVSFLPLFSLPTLIFALPDFAINLLSNNSQLHEIYYQYTAAVTPFLFIATIYGIKTIHKKFPYFTDGKTIALLIMSSLFSVYVLGPLPGSLRPNIDMFTKQLPNRKNISTFLKTIDKSKTVAASNNVGSHLSQRKKIYTIPNGINQADVVALLLNDSYAQPSLSAQKQMAEDLRRNPDYTVLYEDGDFIAFSRLKNAIIP